MSSHFLYLVPRDAEWQPTPEAAGRALALLKARARYPEQIECRFHDVIRFFDCGGNWDGVWYPFCEADLEGWFCTDPAPERWTQQRGSLDAVTPCCSWPTNLNELRFGSPCAFGRFAIEGQDAGAVPDAEYMRTLKAAIGAPLVDVWTHV